jgi:hypothetical protein
MNYLLMIIVVAVILCFISVSNKENFADFNRDYDPDLLYTYELINYPNFISPYYLKNYNYLELADSEPLPAHVCKKCDKLKKEKCGLCQNCGWCIDEKGKGKCVPGDEKGPHFNNDCEIWRHPSRFNRFKPTFSGKTFNKDATHLSA